MADGVLYGREHMYTRKWELMTKIFKIINSAGFFLILTIIVHPYWSISISNGEKNIKSHT
jgi:hypothetical protein